MMDEIKIEYAAAEDCEAIAAVVALVIQGIPYYNELAKQSETEKYNPLALRAKLADDPYSIIIAKIHSSIAGFCLSRFDDYTIWLEWFGVAPQYRKLGLAYVLLQRMEETVVLRKAHKIWCDCRTENTASIHILARHHYRQLVTITDHWYGQDFILWEKKMQ